MGHGARLPCARARAGALRAGYANLFGDDAVSAGGSLGLELVRTDFAFLALDARASALLGTDSGTQLLFQPAATFHVAY